MTSLPIANIDQLVNYVAVKKRNGPSFQQQQQQSTNNKKKTTNKINCSKYNNNDTDITFSPICSNDNEIHTVFSDSSGGDGKESGLSQQQQQQQHLDPNTLMEKGLSWLLKGAEMKIADLQEFQNYQSTQSDKYDAFSSLCDFQKTVGYWKHHTGSDRKTDSTLLYKV